VREDADLARGIRDPRPFDHVAAVSDPGSADDPRALRPLQAELMAAAGAIVLLGSLLFLKWFGLGGAVGSFAPRAATTGSEGAWHTLTLLRWLALVAIVVALAPILVRPARRWLGLPRRMNAAITALGAVTTLLLAYRVLIDLPDPNHVVDQKAGRPCTHRGGAGGVGPAVPVAWPPRSPGSTPDARSRPWDSMPAEYAGEN